MSEENVLKRKEDENLIDYHKRLVYGKLVDKTLADYDYSEIVQYLYGASYSSDFARRMLYGAKRTLDLLAEEDYKALGGAEIVDEIDTKRIELQKERQKFFDQRREYIKLVNEEGRAEHLHDVIKCAADKLSSDIGIMYPAGVCDQDQRQNDAVVVFSDWHYGMKTSNVFNEYNTEICKNRVQNTTLEMIKRIEFHKCDTAHIVVLGDLFHGAIHISARVASEEAVCEQIMHVAEILAQAIYEISKHVSNVNVYLTYGNHARTIQNKKESLFRDNMERLIPWWLAERFRYNPEINIVHESANIGEFIVMDVCGHTFCATHGDLDTVKSSPRLFSTLFNKKYGADVEYILLGDRHHRESFDELGVTSFLCGSLCGSDDYANEHRLYSNPSQILLIVNEDCGVDAEYRIRC